MKKHLLLFSLLLFIVTQTKAQATVYHPFPVTHGDWSYQLYDDVHQPTGFITSNRLSDDTTINSVAYKKIWTGFNMYSGALRESNKIIYFIPDTSAAASEYVLYNFNLNVGDTIFHPFAAEFGNHLDTVIVLSIDSMQLSNGYRRTFQLSGLAEWIEGIGSTHHLLIPTQSFPLSGDDYLDCFWGDGTLVVSWAPECVTNVNEYILNTDFIFLYPNPVTNRLSIHSSPINWQNATISIMNVFGQEVSTMQGLTPALSKGEGDATIDVSGVAAGIYFLQIKSESGTVVKRFVKE